MIFFVIPKQFFIPSIIEKRKPLSSDARRAGWVGCNILLDGVPDSGKVFFIKERKVMPKQKVLHQWKRTLFLREEKKVSLRGWTLDVMKCVENLGKKEFSLGEIYIFEKELARMHPDNKHVRDKIRQQLQILRGKGFLLFTSRGFYRLA